MPYVIEVGHNRPPAIESGHILKGSGGTVISGEKSLVPNIVGDVTIPNVNIIWGQRVINGQALIDGIRVTVSHPKYTGEIKPLKKDDPDGEPITTRYLDGYSTLDAIFQETRLNYKVDMNTDEGMKAFCLTLQNGENIYEDDRYKYLIQHLQTHKHNEDNVSALGESGDFLFREKKEVVIDDEAEALQYSEQFRAVSIVNDCQTVGKLKNLYSIVSSLSEIQPKEGENLYTFLSKLANAKAKEFLSAVNECKRIISDTHVKCESYDALDLTVGGIVVTNVAVKGVCKKGDVLSDNIPDGVKGKQLLGYLFDNFLDEDVFVLEGKIKAITDKLN